MRYTALIFIITAFFCCKAELPDADALVHEFYTARVKRLEDDRKKECIEKQVRKANAKVDSIVHQLLNKDLLDTISFPAKPLKPIKPKPIIGTVDTFEVLKKGDTDQPIK